MTTTEENKTDNLVKLHEDLQRNNLSYYLWQQMEDLISQLERVTHPMADDKDLEDAKNLIAVYRELLTPFCGLDTRAINCLVNGNYASKEAVREAFISGKIKPKFRRNYGPKTHARVAKWLNLPTTN
jgi:hypothetical protein